MLYFHCSHFLSHWFTHLLLPHEVKRRGVCHRAHSSYNMATIRFYSAKEINKTKVLVLLGVLVLLLVWNWKFRGPTVVTKEPIFQRTLNRVRNSPGEFCLVSYNILYDQAIINAPSKYLPLPMEKKLKKPNPNTSLRHVQLMKEVGQFMVALQT